jgi:3-keto-disaccharide hydrolase
MKSFVAVPVLLALAMPACADDWVKLFNGSDLTGWKIPPKTNNDFTEIIPVKSNDGKVTGYDAKLKDGKTVHLWRVEDGILIGSGPHSHLFTERGDYTDFEYKVVAMINDHGNSGQYFRTKFEGGFPRGYEAQIDATHADKIRTGSLYPDGRTNLGKYRDQICVMNTAPHKPNEWFTQEVTAKGNHIVIKVNGKVTVDFMDPDNTYTKGHFALQGHDPGTVVKFKSVEVKELK